MPAGLHNSLFTPLENPSIPACRQTGRNAGEGGNRKHQLLIEGGTKALSFLMGFTFLLLALWETIKTSNASLTFLTWYHVEGF